MQGGTESTAPIAAPRQALRGKVRRQRWQAVAPPLSQWQQAADVVCMRSASPACHLPLCAPSCRAPGQRAALDRRTGAHAGSPGPPARRHPQAAAHLRVSVCVAGNRGTLLGGVAGGLGEVLTWRGDRGIQGAGASTLVHPTGPRSPVLPTFWLASHSYEMAADYGTLLAQYRFGTEDCVPRFFKPGNKSVLSSALLQQRVCIPRAWARRHALRRAAPATQPAPPARLLSTWTATPLQPGRTAWSLGCWR